MLPVTSTHAAVWLTGCCWAFACAVLCHADWDAAEYFMQFQYGWMADPIYFGDYPKIMRETQVGRHTVSLSAKDLAIPTYILHR